MTQNEDTLKRYALEFIKRTSSTNHVEQFVLYCNLQDDLNWSEESFESIYKNFCQNSSAGEKASQQNTRSDNGQTSSPTQTQNPTHIIYINVHDARNRRWDFWDHLLLQLWIDSLFNRSNVNNGHTNNQDEQQKSEDNKKSSALGILAVVLMMMFHGSICYFYSSSREQAKKEEKIDYLDNKLKMFRNIEFAGCAVSLIALIACTVYPVLPTWGLVALGINALACAVGGVAFQKKHEKESENITEAGVAVDKYLQDTTTQNHSQTQSPPPSCAQANGNPFDNQPPSNLFYQSRVM